MAGVHASWAKVTLLCNQGLGLLVQVYSQGEGGTAQTLTGVLVADRSLAVMSRR
jgi:hypothetical protein